MKYRSDFSVYNPPVICGKFNNSEDVARYIGGTNHSVLLDYILLFAYLGDDSDIRSVIITTSSYIDKLSISVVYTNYSMIYTSMYANWLLRFIEKVGEDKKLKVLYNGLVSRFLDQ